MPGSEIGVNLEKTVQMNLKALSVDTTFYMNSDNIPVKPVCKYLGINLDRKLSYQYHIDFVKERLSKQCGTVHIQQKSCWNIILLMLLLSCSMVL